LVIKVLQTPVSSIMPTRNAMSELLGAPGMLAVLQEAVLKVLLYVN
jgi:hypothetical protein